MVYIYYGTLRVGIALCLEIEVAGCVGLERCMDERGEGEGRRARGTVRALAVADALKPRVVHDLLLDHQRLHASTLVCNMTTLQQFRLSSSFSFTRRLVCCILPSQT